MDNTESQNWKIQILLVLYFGIGCLEVLVEFYQDLCLIYLLKPLLIPILASYYWIQSKQRNAHLFYALFFVLLANFFFISNDFYSLVIASVFFLVYRGIIISLVIKTVRIKKVLPVFLGSLPFGAAFIYLTLLTHEELGSGVYIYCLQILFLIVLGGYALANYMIEDSKKNFWLLLHTVLFAVIQFILVLKLFYISVNIFQPISMFLYTIAQYAIVKYILCTEEEQSSIK